MFGGVARGSVASKAQREACRIRDPERTTSIGGRRRWIPWTLRYQIRLTLKLLARFHRLLGWQDSVIRLGEPRDATRELQSAPCAQFSEKVCQMKRSAIAGLFRTSDRSVAGDDSFDGRGLPAFTINALRRICSLRRKHSGTRLEMRPKNASREFILK